LAGRFQTVLNDLLNDPNSNAMNIRLSTFALIGGMLLLQNCNAYLHQPMQTQDARLGEPTAMSLALRDLPKPPEPIVAAVYKFRDQTGQYKLQEVGSSFSTVVTQGATNILVKAMEDSGWFTPIERENVNNLLNERKIIRSTRAQYSQEGGPQPQLPPLLFAGILLEGGIISYDSNILTGGAGLRYFGAGASGQYRQDRVTVYLRAISTSNGKILKTVYTSKTILSQALDGGIFRFVSFQRLLEAETGFTYNEPSEMAVMEAIEKAVYSLIVEGINDGLWDVAESDQNAKAETLQEYRDEKEASAKMDVFGRVLYRENPRQPSVRLGGNGYVYAGDLENGAIRGGLEIGAELPLTSALSVAPGLSWGTLATSDSYSERILGVDLNLQWRLLPYNRFTPYLYGGGGLLLDEDGQSAADPQRSYFKGQFGGGLEYFVTPTLSLDLGLDYNYLLNDEIDRLERGSYNDIYYRGRIGVRYFFNTSLTGKN
jgi:curli production assembly/transport component CsgG